MKYTDKQLLDRVKMIPSFRGIPPDYWILGVQSNQDAFNEFDDKFYMFKGEKFIAVTTGTTNAGISGLRNYNRYSTLGCAVIKTDEWYHGLWKYGLHRGKMKALRQIRNIKYYRDNDFDKQAEQMGKMYEGIIGINFHTVTYEFKPGFIASLIGGWSVGCQVLNNVTDYYKFLSIVESQDSVSYCLIKEF